MRDEWALHVVGEWRSTGILLTHVSEARHGAPGVVVIPLEGLGEGRGELHRAALRMTEVRVLTPMSQKRDMGHPEWVIRLRVGGWDEAPGIPRSRCSEVD